MLVVLYWVLVYCMLMQMPCALMQMRYFLLQNPACFGNTVVCHVVSLKLDPVELDRSSTALWQVNHRQLTDSCYLFIKFLLVFI